MNYEELEEQRRKSWSRKKPYKGSNIIILGVGHSGTTILTQMLNSLGWDIGDADEQYWESAKVREINRAIYSGETGVHINENFFAEFKEPWVIKDPRFVWTLSYWAKVFQSQLGELPLVLFLQREKADVLNSYKKRGEKEPYYQLKLDSAKAKYEAWPGPKCTIDYEDIATSCELFKKPLKPIKFLLFTASLNRPYMLRQCVLNIKNQSYGNFHHSIAINRYPIDSDKYDDWNREHGRENELQYGELLDDIVDDRWTIRSYINGNQHINYLNALNQVNIDDYDYFIKIDDDEIHKRDYLTSIYQYIIDSDKFDVLTSKILLRLNACFLERGGPWGNMGGMPPNIGMPGTMVFNREAMKEVINMPLEEWTKGYEDTAWLNYLHDKKQKVFVLGPCQPNFIWHLHGGYASGKPNLSTSDWVRKING